jgi:hypothetical protein
MMSEDETIATIARAPSHPARIRIPRLFQERPGSIGGRRVDVPGLARSTACERLPALKAAGPLTGGTDGPRNRNAPHPVGQLPLALFSQPRRCPMKVPAAALRPGTRHEPL